MNACWCLKDGTEACETCQGKVAYPDDEFEKEYRKRKRQQAAEEADCFDEGFYFPV